MMSAGAHRPGRTLWKGRRRTKGHQDHAIALRQAMLPGTGMSTEAMLATMRATIQAADRAWDLSAIGCRVDWQDTAEANHRTGVVHTLFRCQGGALAPLPCAASSTRARFHKGSVLR